jgi:hypothetical protein
MRNQFLIGRVLYERIHVQWLERCARLDIDLSERVGVDEYEVYAVA